MSKTARSAAAPGARSESTRSESARPKAPATDPFAGPSWEDIRADRLARDPDLAAQYERTRPRARLADALRAERQRAGLSLRQLAAEAGWNHSYVSRMESVTAPWPSLESIGRYLDACGTGAVYGLVIAAQDAQELDVRASATLNEGESDPLGALSGTRIPRAQGQPA